MASVSYIGKSGAEIIVDINDTNQGTSANSKALYNAGYRNGNIDTGNLQSINVGGHRLYKDAANAFIQMASAYKSDTGKTLTVTDSYRPLSVQIDLIRRKGKYGKEAPKGTPYEQGLAATPGTSNHGWALAVDVVGAEIYGTDTYNWLVSNASKFGFTNIPKEPWHWEYTSKPLQQPITPATTLPTTTTTPETSTTQQQSSSDTDGTAGYIQQTYESAYTTPPSEQNKKTYQDTLYPQLDQTRNIMLTNQKIQGEVKLIQLLDGFKTETDTKVSQATKNIAGFSLEAQRDLITSTLFSLSPDIMRTLMYQNHDKYDPSAGPDASHAWRAPGKLAITATFTIPGMSGFRIAQVFWIDRISEYYKTFGAFQLFGLTEHIDISKGWTTEIYSRFNAIPPKSLANLKDYPHVDL